MDWLKEWWPFLAAVGAAMLGTIKYLFSHGKKHAEIDRRLDDGAKHFSSNDEDHERIIEKVEALEGGTGEVKLTVAKVATNVEWLVDAEKKRNGTNG